MAACGQGIEEDEVVPKWGRLEVEEDLRIGEDEGPPEYLFGRIRSIAQLEDGTVLIADATRTTASVRRYSRDGRFLNHIGELGQGPGEFQTVWDVGQTPDGKVAVWDPQSRRLSLFTPDGGFLASFAVESGLFASHALIVGRSPHVYVLDQRPNTDIRRYLKYSPAGELTGAIPLPPAENTNERGWGYVTSDGGLGPFNREVLSAITTDGSLIYGHNDRYELRVEHPDREPIEIKRNVPQIELTPEEHAEWEALRIDNWRQRRALPSSAAVDVVPEYEPIPEVKPALANLSPGADATIWIEPYARAEKLSVEERERPDGTLAPVLSWRQPKVFDIWNTDGEMLGTVTLPHGVRPLSLHSAWIWTVQRTELGEMIAVRFTLRRGEVTSDAAEE